MDSDPLQYDLNHKEGKENNNSYHTKDSIPDTPKKPKPL